MTPLRRLADAGFQTPVLEHIISRLDPLDDYSGFDTLLVNLHFALLAISRHLPALLPAPLVQAIPILAAITRHIDSVGIGTIATASDSGRDGVVNTTYGKFKDRPLYAAYVEDARELPDDFRDPVYLCFGLLLLARLGIQAPIAPTAKEILIADGLRKLISKEAWHPVRVFLPEADEGFISELQSLDRTDRRLETLSQSQRDFVGALSTLGESWSRHRRRPTINRVEHSAFEDDEHEIGGRVRRIRFEVAGGEEVDSQEIEPADTIEIVETDPVPARDADKLPEHRLSISAIYAAQRSCRDNQFLPNRWRALTEQEATEFVSRARAHLAADSGGRQKQAALVASLVFITSQRPDAIAEFVVVEHVDPALLGTYMTEHVIDLGRKVWWHSWPALPGRFMPTPEQTESLLPYTDWIPLPLPGDICEALSGYGGYPMLLGDCLGCLRTDMERLHMEFCRSLQGGSNRTSPARVRAHGFDYTVRQTADDTFASGLQGTVEYAPYNPLYYYAFSVEDGVQAHIHRMHSVGWPVSASAVLPGGLYFGSRLQPSESAIEGLIGGLRNRLATARAGHEEDRQPATLAGVHNALATYTLAMVIFATGHRRAREYSVARWTLDLPNLNLMIADKIVGTANSVRTVPLPAMAASQVNAYLDHLGYLASRISRFNPELAAKVRSLCQDNPARDAIPLFFLLDEGLSNYRGLSHEVLHETVGDAWLLPWHAARHRLEMDTRAGNLTAEYNHYRAGHISTGQQPYSPVSPLVPERTLKASAEVADQILRGYGWSVEAGLSGRLRTPGHFERKAASGFTNFYLPAPVVKAQSVGAVSNIRVVLAAIAAVKEVLGKQSGLNDAAVELIRNRIVQASNEHPFLVAERLNLLRKILKHGHKTGTFRLSKLPGVAAQWQETPAFQPDAAWRVRQGEALRQGFLDAIALNEAKTFEDHLDRIAFSLVAFSAFTDATTLVHALKACFDMAFSEAGYFWIEFLTSPKGLDGGRVLNRRPLDPVTTCLVLTARARFGAKLPPTYFVADGLRKGLNRSAEMAIRHAGIPIDPIRSLEDCCRAFVPYWRFRLPGIHAALCEGRSSAASMARPDFLRMLIGIRPAEGGEAAPIGEPVHVEISKPKHHALGFVKARKLMRRIGQILRAAHSDSVSGGRVASHYAFKLHRARKEMAALQERLSQAPLILQAIADWLVHLMEEGGSSGKRLQASSIATYFWSIGYPLLEFFLDEDISTLDEDAFEDLYSHALDSRSENTRIKRARILRQFHAYCVARYGCPEVDWYEIEPLIDTSNNYVDANIVTPREYAQALNALQPHIDAGVLHAFKLKALLVLMYRAGLRLGEAFRLTVDDFLMTDDAFIVFVRGNRFGRPKTANGRRQIHLGWRMLAEEREFVMRMIENRRGLCGEAPETALFGSTANPHELDLRRNLERSLGVLLRWATGRNALRPHHLRHSMASYAVSSQFDLPPESHFAKEVAAYFCGADEAGKRLRLELLGHRELSRRVMHAICNETGHGSPRILLSVYANCLEISLAEHLRNSAPTSIGDPDEVDARRTASSLNKYARPAALTGFSDGHLRKLMHDGIDVTNPAILAHELKRRSPSPHGVAIVHDQSSAVFVPDWEALQHPTLEQIHGVLAAVAQGLKAHKIAEITLLNEELVDSFIDTARRLSRFCRYEGYKLAATVESWAVVDSASPQARIKRTPNTPKEGRGGDALARFRLALSNIEDSIVREGLLAWARSYRPSVRGLLCDDPKDFKSFWDFMRRIGYDEERLVVAVPTVITAKRNTFRERLMALGIPTHAIQRMGPKYRGGAAGPAPIIPSLVIKRSADSAITPASCPMGVIHQYCYLCLVKAALTGI